MIPYTARMMGIEVNSFVARNPSGLVKSSMSPTIAFMKGGILSMMLLSSGNIEIVG